MSIFDYFTKDDNLRVLLKSKKKLKYLLREIEKYIFYMHEKFELVAYIRTFPKEIKFIKKDENENYYKHKSVVNKKIKRIIKIIKVEVKKDESSVKCANFIESLIKIHELLDEFSWVKEEKYGLKSFQHSLNDLRFNLQRQLAYFERIYPMREWSLQENEKIIGPEIINLLNEELKLVFFDNMPNLPIESLPALIQSKLNKQELPDYLFVKKLLKYSQLAIDKNRREYFNFRERIQCYHGDPIEISSRCFPLSVDRHTRGFYVDTDLKEAFEFITSYYQSTGIIEKDCAHFLFFEILIPRTLFYRLFREDINAGNLIDGGRAKLDKSFIIKPTNFVQFNNYLQRGLITYRSLSFKEVFERVK